MNPQPIEKRLANDDGSSLEIHSIFKTIQGEGPFTGHPAVFIRLAGCNLQCPSCDTDYTSKRTILSSYDIGAMANALSALPLVVITGGEPFRQNITPLVKRLIRIGCTVQIETNGTLPPPEGLAELCSNDLTESNACFVVCSPKTKKVSDEVRRIAVAFKYVMSHDSVSDDGLPEQVLDHNGGGTVARPLSCVTPVYLQPCDDKDNIINRANLEACVRSVMLHGYILQLQVHKIINVE